MAANSNFQRCCRHSYCNCISNPKSQVTIKRRQAAGLDRITYELLALALAPPRDLGLLRGPAAEEVTLRRRKRTDSLERFIGCPARRRAAILQMGYIHPSADIVNHRSLIGLIACSPNLSFDLAIGQRASGIGHPRHFPFYLQTHLRLAAARAWFSATLRERWSCFWMF